MQCEAALASLLHSAFPLTVKNRFIERITYAGKLGGQRSSCTPFLLHWK